MRNNRKFLKWRTYRDKLPKSADIYEIPSGTAEFKKAAEIAGRRAFRRKPDKVCSKCFRPQLRIPYLKDGTQDYSQYICGNCGSKEPNPAWQGGPPPSHLVIH